MFEESSPDKPDGVYTLHDLIGHSANPPSQPEEQSLYDHMAGVAHRAAAFTDVFDSAPFGNWLGWWHDAGKVAADVQRYLRGETGWKRGPDHSSAGMLEAWEDLPYLANIIAGHHSGLSDIADLKERITKKEGEARVTEARELAGKMLRGIVDLPSPAEVPAFIRRGNNSVQRRRIAFWQRMLHSALVDADRLDAAAHGHPEEGAMSEHESPDVSTLRDVLIANQEALIRHSADTPVNRVREAVYRACLDKAELPRGFFSLTVPTGGGKTRSVLAFTLPHAAMHGQRRVVLVLPYTSIIEQNAAVYRDILGADAVLEHHSGVHQREPKKGEEVDEETERKITLAAENWNASVVVTTTVQLFESLFAARNSRLRKLHRLARSVIVLDEAQTLPPELLVPTLEVLRFLVEDYGCTVVFCTATQPAFRSSYGDRYRGHFEGFDITEIIADPAQLYADLRRVQYEVHAEESWSWEQVAAQMRSESQSLAIVNTVKDAQALFNELDDPNAFHLSTRMCPGHRRRVLAEVIRRLRAKLPVHLVATQVVEAGVDISFPLVLRAIGPLDSIIQAAGRCNREGALNGFGRVVVFVPKEGGMPPGSYQAGADQTRMLLRKYGDIFEERLHSPDLPPEYFQLLYGTQNLDKHGIRQLEESGQFRETERRYRFIEETVGVVVPYLPQDDDASVRECEEVLRRITARGAAWRDDWRKLQSYTVNLRERLHEQAVRDGLCVEVVPGIWRWCGAYDSRLQGRGLDWQHAADETLIC